MAALMSVKSAGASAAGIARERCGGLVASEPVRAAIGATRGCWASRGRSPLASLGKRQMTAVSCVGAKGRVSEPFANGRARAHLAKHLRIYIALWLRRRAAASAIARLRAHCRVDLHEQPLRRAEEDAEARRNPIQRGHKVALRALPGLRARVCDSEQESEKRGRGD
jgi:hypothetical protein